MSVRHLLDVPVIAAERIANDIVITAAKGYVVACRGVGRHPVHWYVPVGRLGVVLAGQLGGHHLHGRARGGGRPPEGRRRRQSDGREPAGHLEIVVAIGVGQRRRRQDERQASNNGDSIHFRRRCPSSRLR
jgi:hypothetical protein